MTCDLIKDSSEFRDDSSDQKLRRLSDDCKDDFSKCEILVLKIQQVTVSSNLNPVNEIENARAIEEAAADIVTSGIFYWLMFFTISSLFGLVVLFYKKRADWSIQETVSSISRNLIQRFASVISKLKSYRTK